MNIEVVNTKKGTQPGGHYSQGLIHNNILYTAGQVPADPETNELVNENIEAETTRTLENLKGIAEAAGTSLANTLKVTVYLTDMDLFHRFNTVYAKYFSINPPARSTVAISKLLRDVHIEIDAIIAIPN